MPDVAQPRSNSTEELFAYLRGLPGAVVAFSGGVDSTMLLHACVAALGDAVVAVTADSPSLPRSELRECEQLARHLHARHVVIATREQDRAGYRENGADRCYFCKTELFEQIAAQIGAAGPDGWPVLYGAIGDDVLDHRPGARAASEHRVRAPLAELGWSKVAVRDYSRAHGLPTADKPSFACLASRVPYGTEVTTEILSQLERAEAVLRDLGYDQVRVRHHGTIARIEVLARDFPRAVGADREAIVRGVAAAGYAYVSLDLQGYRTGSMNEVL